MIFETTIKIDPFVKEKLAEFSEITSLSVSYLIKFLLKKLNERYIRYEIADGLIKYQSHRPPHTYENFHFKLSNEEKNCFELMRISHKTSISYLLFIAFLLFFKDLIKKYRKNFKRIKSNNFVDSYSSNYNIPSYFVQKHEITMDDST
ncbi:MAG: hypothetical protein JW982_06795 [Spirochaetes bacterium]|nr:hypothetical protein [Spirochaetota bacterium]